MNLGSESAFKGQEEGVRGTWLNDRTTRCQSLAQRRFRALMNTLDGHWCQSLAQGRAGQRKLRLWQATGSLTRSRAQLARQASVVLQDNLLEPLQASNPCQDA